MFYEKYNGTVFEKPVYCFNEDTADLYCPVEIDTEFQERHFPFVEAKDIVKKTISVQMKPICGKPTFFLHKDMLEHSSEFPQYPVLKHDFAVFDLMDKCDYKVSSINESSYDDIITYSNMYIHIYGYYLVADIMRIVSGEWSKLFESRICEKNHLSGNIEHARRLTTYNHKTHRCSTKRTYLDTCKYVKILNKCFRVHIHLHDNCCIQGNIGYATFCSNTSVLLKHKNDLSQHKIKHMYETFHSEPKIVEQYANGDLKNFEAFQGHVVLLIQLYKLLDLEEYFKRSRNTIGMCVYDILEATLLRNFEFSNREELKEAVCDASHDCLIDNPSSTKIYLAKTNGGRCYNNRPTEATFKGVLADVDIKGCYATSMSSQDYPIGRPVIIDYNKKSKYNLYETLYDFLRKYEEELIDGLWFCRISTNEDLSFKQDYFQSWFPSSNVNDLLKSDIDYDDSFENCDSDETRIYSHQIHLGVLQSDGLEWLRNFVCKAERVEFLKKVMVISAVYYPKSKECKTLAEYKQMNRAHKGRNSTAAYNYSDMVVIYKTTRECHYWYKANIGEILINKLSNLRTRYDKTNPTEAPMNQFIKLIINTIYGDLVSPHFYTANTVVGNNITARARSMAWYMEKALHGIQTITDGCAFEVNKIVKSRRRFFTNKYNKLKQKEQDRNFSLGYLYHKKMLSVDIETLKENNYEELTDRIEKQIRSLFGAAKVVNIFDIEVRHVFTGMTTHGPSNYQMLVGGKILKTKMRSYQNKEYIEFDIEKKEVKKITSRVEEWLYNIYENPMKVKRVEPFVEEQIVKTKQYVHQQDRLKRRGIGVGEIDYTARLITECSISMFTYQTHKQYKTWKKEHDELRKSHKQSIEGHYQDDDGDINYMKMINEIQDKIDKGDKKFYKTYKNIKEHPKKYKLDDINEYIENTIEELVYR